MSAGAFFQKLKLDLPWMKWAAVVMLAVVVLAVMNYMHLASVQRRLDRLTELNQVAAELRRIREQERLKDSVIVAMHDSVYAVQARATSAKARADQLGTSVKRLEAQLAGQGTAQDSIRVLVHANDTLHSQVEQLTVAFNEQLKATANLMQVTDELRAQRDTARAQRDHLLRLVDNLPPPTPPCRVLGVSCKTALAVTSVITVVAVTR